MLIMESAALRLGLKEEEHMKTLAAVLVLVVAAASFGGVVFSPEKQDVKPGEPAVFILTVENAEQFNGADIVVGSDDVLSMSFVYSETWKSSMPGGWPSAGANPAGVYASDLYLTGNNVIGGFFNSLELGTLTIDTTGLKNGIYTLKIDSDFDGFFSSLSTGEGLYSSASFSVPEPATMALLALGGLLIARRRQA